MLRYSILDPTGNITAIVESPVEIAGQSAVAGAIMRRHPAVEQVGFLNRLTDGESACAQLRMAGGEFCGNASMSAAALLLSQSARKSGGTTLRLRVSGAAEPVVLHLRPEGEDAWLAEIVMPQALGIAETAFAFGGLHGTLPLVRMEGISHLVVEADSCFFGLLNDRPAAEQAVREFCGMLHADGLGLLFLDGDGTERRMTPLVYVPGSGTCFWENSCASGSAAVGIWLASKAGRASALSLCEPGGVLWVQCDPKSGETRLRGHVCLTERLEIPEAEL